MPLIVDGVEIPIEASVDHASFAQVDAELKKLGKDVDTFTAKNKARRDAQAAADKAAIKAQEDYRKALNRTREDMEKLQQIGRTMLMAGAVILGPMILSAKNFADKANAADAAANQWKASMSSLDISSQRAGRVIADELNPALNETAQLISKVVGFIEKNPDLMGAIGAVGGGLVSIGALITVVSQVEKTVATMKLLAAGEGALGGLGAALVPVTIAAITIGALTAISAAVANANGYGGTSGIRGSILTGGLNPNNLTPKEQAAQLKAGGGTFSPFIGGVGPVSETSRDYMGGNGPTLAAKLAAQKLQQDYANEKAKTEAETQKKIIDVLNKYGKERASVVATLEADNAKAYADYQNNRAQAVRETENQIEQIRRDSQKRLQELEKGHGQRVYDLLAARDALGLVKENKDYDDKKKAEQDASRDEIAQRRHDLRVKLDDLAKSYNAEMKQRKAVADAKLKLLVQERDAELAIVAQKTQALLAVLVGAFDAAINGTTAAAPAASTGGTGGGVGGRANAYAKGGAFTVPAAYGHEGFRMGGIATASAGETIGILPKGGMMGGITLNINLGEGGSISQFRKTYATMKAELVREIGNALEGV